MKTLLLLLALSGSGLALAQSASPTRLLASGYVAQPSEQATSSLVAQNVIASFQAVDYVAGQSIDLLPGFATTEGCTFTAYTGAVSLGELSEAASNRLRINAYPNPFQEGFTASYVLTKTATVNLYLCDEEGRKVSQLVTNEVQEAGTHQLRWQNSLARPGVYLFVLEAGGERTSKRLIRK